MINKEELKKELTEQFQEEFAVSTKRAEDDTLMDFGLHEDMADLTYIADWWLEKIDKAVEERNKRFAEVLFELDISDREYQLALKTLQINNSKGIE